MVERSELDRTLAALFSGWTALLVPLLLVFVILGLWGIFAGRHLRSEKVSPMPWPLLLVVYGEILLLKVWDGPWPTVAVLAAALLVAGTMARVERTGVMLLPGILLGALLGTGQLLSALVLGAVGLVVFIIAPAKG
ncbi:MAG: hypothetical protein JNM31_07585 [Flavobacteriales bacterium]|nr:hypothetical protein [Flavobacteriales bacterium]